MQETNPQVQRRCLKNMNPKLPPLPSYRLVFIKIWLLWSEAVVWRKPQFHLGEKNRPFFGGINESYYSCAYLESTVNTEARGWEADDEFAFPPELSASSKAWVFANGNRIFYCAIWQSFDSMYRFLPKKSAAKFASSDTYDKSAGCGNRGSCSRPMKDR